MVILVERDWVGVVSIFHFALSVLFGFLFLTCYFSIFQQGLSGQGDVEPFIVCIFNPFVLKM